MERDKTGEIVFLPLSSHPFFRPALILHLPSVAVRFGDDRCIPHTSARYIPDKMQNFVGAFYLAVIILSLFVSSLIKLTTLGL